MATILIVEDRSPDRRQLAKLLRSDGHRVLESTDAEEALLLLAAEPADLVITDVLIPTATGQEFVSRLRGVPGFQHTPVVFYTARYHEREARALAEECGVVDILTKPNDTILATVRSALGAGPGASRAAERPAGDEHVEATEQRLAAIVDLAQQIAAERNPMALMKRVCAEARRVTLAQRAVLALLNENKSTVHRLIATGFRAGTETGRTSSPVQGELLRMMTDRKPMRTRNQAGRPEALGLPASEPPCFSFLAVPIATPTRVYGWISLRNKLGAAEFSQADEASASALATHAGIAYENLLFCNELRGHALALEKEIGERREIEERLRANEDRTQFALGAARMRVWEWDLAHDRITPFDDLAAENPARELPRSRKELLDRVHPDDRGLLNESLDRAIADRKPMAAEVRTVWPDGSVHWVDTRARVVTDATGKATRVLGVSTDVSERKLLEAQLRQAQKMEAIGQLAGGVAHDFNNLLTAILGYANLLSDDLGPTDPRRSDVEEIGKAARRAAALTRQLLAFSRKQMLQPTLVHLNALIQETSQLLTRVIGENIQIESVLASVHDVIHADPTQLEQIVMNLAVNARDAMPAGGRLLIETADVEIDDLYAKRHVESVVQAGAYVMLAVSDTGTGIDEQTKRRLFEPFFTTKAQGKGTGLGLATVYGIVKQSGGYVWVYSEPGLGTTFKVYLPRAYTPPPAIAADRLTSAAARETVLVIEDEEAVRFLARMVLERAGYRVLTASSPEDAEAVFSDHADEIDLLVSDVVMPGVSGPTLFDRLTKRRPSLRVLFVSGYTGEAIFRHHGLDATAAFVQKPFTGEGLVRKVREVLDATKIG